MLITPHTITTIITQINWMGDWKLQNYCFSDEVCESSVTLDFYGKGVVQSNSRHKLCVA